MLVRHSFQRHGAFIAAFLIDRWKMTIKRSSPSHSEFFTAPLPILLRCKTNAAVGAVCAIATAGTCRTNPWPAVPDWTLMPECRCLTEAADYRKTPAFRHLHMIFQYHIARITPSATVFGRAMCITFHCQHYERSRSVSFYRQHYEQWTCRLCGTRLLSATRPSKLINGCQGHPLFCLSPGTAQRQRKRKGWTCNHFIQPTLADSCRWHKVWKADMRCGLGLKTEKIHLLWFMYNDIIHTLRHQFLIWTSLCLSLQQNSYWSHAAIRLLFSDFWLAIAIWAVAWHSSSPVKDK